MEKNSLQSIFSEELSNNIASWSKKQRNQTSKNENICQTTMKWSNRYKY